jgi:hypothetical protein
MKSLHTPSLKKSGVGRILLYVGCVVLFGGIHFALLLGRVFADFGVVTGSLVASVGGRDGRHFIVTWHFCFPYSRDWFEASDGNDIHVAVRFDSNEIFSSSSFVTSIRLSVSTLQSFRISSWATSSPGVGIDFCIFDTMTGLAVNLIEADFFRNRTWPDTKLPDK